jgi:GAF domain-containing protein/HAMP domain-containing protein
MREPLMAPTQLKNTAESEQSLAWRRKNALWISAATAVIMTAITVSIVLIFQHENANNYTVPYLSGLMVLAALFSLLLSYRGQVNGGIGILLGSLLLLTTLLPYLAPGQVIAPTLANIIMVTAIASVTLSGEWASRTSITAIVLALLIVVADQILPVGFGLQSSSTGNTAISISLAIFYAIIILWRYRSYNLRTKILLAFIIVAFVPLVSLGVYNTYYGRLELEKQARQNLKTLAQNAADQADTYLNNQLNSLRVEAQQPSIAAYMSLPSFKRNESPEEADALRTLNTFLRKDPIFIYSYALLDSSGRDILDTVEAQIGREEGKQDYFQKPLTTGLPYVSGLTFEANDKTVLHFSAPVRNLSGDIIGVLRAEYNADIFQSIMLSLMKNHETQGLLLSLVDKETFVQLAFTGDRTQLYKTLYNYGPIDMALLQSSGRLRQGTPDEVILFSSDDISGIQNIDTNAFFLTHVSALGGQSLTTGAHLSAENWIAIARQSETVLFEPIREQNRKVVQISIGLVLFAIVAALIAAQVISSPLVGLTSTANKLALGDLAARAVISTNDEIGELARTFNRMSDQLNQTLGGLESRVTERTLELENARFQSEARARDLETISDVARIISTEQKLEALLPLITNLVSEKFNHYHTGIFLLELGGRFAILQAANSEGGRRMLQHGHRLEVGQTGIVGYVAQTGQPRIALDVGADAVFFNNPDLPDTRSEIALPLNVRGETIGVLDVQSTEQGVFSEDDLNTLTILADQVAIAIENARLFGQTQDALAEVQSVYRQYISQEWGDFAARRYSLGYRQTMSGGTRIEVEEDSPLLKTALERGEVIVIHSRDVQTDSLAMPVKLRGQSIGFINIQSARKGHEWSVDEIGLVQAVSDRLAISLENARLFEESTRRAELERISADISGKIGSTIQIETILQITAQELSNALGGGTEVLVQIQPESPVDTLPAIKK